MYVGIDTWTNSTSASSPPSLLIVTRLAGNEFGATVRIGRRFELVTERDVMETVMGSASWHIDWTERFVLTAVLIFQIYSGAVIWPTANDAHNGTLLPRHLLRLSR